jgi:hypothetical protein
MVEAIRTIAQIPTIRITTASRTWHSSAQGRQLKTVRAFGLKSAHYSALISRDGRNSSSISRPCGVVVSHQLSPSDLKLSPASAIAARVLSKSLVERASLSSLHTTRVSPGCC